MSNFETGASCASENAAGNVKDQCLGVLSMDTSCHNKFEPPKGDGKPLLDGVGQHGSGRGNANGQNGNDSSKATDGSSNRQQDIGSSSKATSEAHSNAPNTVRLMLEILVLRVQTSNLMLVFFQNNRVPSEAFKLTYIAPALGKLVLGIEEIDSVEAAFGFCLVGYVMGPRPSPYVLINFVKGWGNEVKFTFKENGWIRCQFPSAE